MNAKKNTKPATAKQSTPAKDSKQQNKPLVSPSTTLKMTFPWEQVQPVYAKTLSQMSKSLKLDGFRKGKVPASIAKQYLNHESIVERTTQQLLQETYAPFIEKSGKKPLGRPEFQITAAPEGGEWQVNVMIAERPKIELVDFDKNLKKIRKDRVADAKKRAEELQKSEKARKDAEGKEKPQLDEAAQQQLAERQARQERERLLGFTYAQIILTYKPVIPELLVKQEAEEQLHQLSHQLTHFKLSLNEYLQQRGMTEDQLMQEVTESALNRLQLAFIIDELIKDKKLEPDQKTILAALQKESQEAQDYYAKNPEARTAFANRLAQQALEELLLAE